MFARARPDAMRPASLAGSLAACLGASHLQVGAAAAQHYLYPGQARVWEDGLGGHVIRALPVLDAGLALNLRVICNPSIFYNGKSEETSCHPCRGIASGSPHYMLCHPWCLSHIWG